MAVTLKKLIRDFENFFAILKFIFWVQIVDLPYNRWTRLQIKKVKKHPVLLIF